MDEIKCKLCNEPMYINLDEWGRTPFHLHCKKCGINIGGPSPKCCINIMTEYYIPKNTWIEFYDNNIQTFEGDTYKKNILKQASESYDKIYDAYVESMNKTDIFFEKMAKLYDIETVEYLNMEEKMKEHQRMFGDLLNILYEDHVQCYKYYNIINNRLKNSETENISLSEKEASDLLLLLYKNI